MKSCPFCNEQIKNEAIKCRYCGEFLKKVNTWKGSLGYTSSILSIVLFFVPILGIILSILGIIFSSLQKRTIKTSWAKYGYVIGIIGLIIGLSWNIGLALTWGTTFQQGVEKGLNEGYESAITQEEQSENQYLELLKQEAISECNELNRIIGRWNINLEKIQTSTTLDSTINIANEYIEGYHTTEDNCNRLIDESQIYDREVSSFIIDTCNSCLTKTQTNIEVMRNQVGNIKEIRDTEESQKRALELLLATLAAI